MFPARRDEKGKTDAVFGLGKDSQTDATRTRQAAVAGTFYPNKADALRSTIDIELAAASATVPVDGRQPKALIVPHAGYIYSGPIAASAYARLAPSRDNISRVVLVGPAHRFPVRSMALSAADQWLTPLGPVLIDSAARDAIREMPGVEIDDRPHADEHSLEVQLPFLQRVLNDLFKLVPIVVGHADPAEVGAVLDALWGGDETLIVISSDLSHYNDYETARQLDSATAAAIVAGRISDIDPHDACGAYPVRGMLDAADRHDLDIELIDLRNSGDTAGPTDRVVGYGSFVLSARSETNFSDEERQLMLAVAEEAIRAELETRAPRQLEYSTLPQTIADHGATFVTLRDGERLLGCIGTMTPHRPLVEDIADNAVGAAFRDPRMPMLTPDEFERMSIHISVLTPMEPFVATSYNELTATLRPTIDGLLVEAGRNRGTFLPAVWEQLPDPHEFLAHLWRKAELKPGAWPRNIKLWRYQTIEFGNKGPRTPIAH